MKSENRRGNVPAGAMFFAAYVGPSMNPTLREPEIMEIMPYNKKPLRVGVFRAEGRDQVRLLMGRRIIGSYDDDRHQWQIRRPFRFLVDGRALPRPQDQDKSNRGFRLNGDEP